MISGKGFHGGGGDRVNRFVHSLGKLLREVADQERNIAVALAKWRRPDRGKNQTGEEGSAGILFPSTCLQPLRLGGEPITALAHPPPPDPTRQISPLAH